MTQNETHPVEDTDGEPLGDFEAFAADPIRDVCRSATLSGTDVHFEDIDEWGPGLTLLVDATEAVVRREVVA